MPRCSNKSQTAKAVTFPTSTKVEDISASLSHPDVSGKDTSESLWFVHKLKGLPPKIQTGPSHAKARPEGWIPRPRNNFIIFRSFVLGEKVLPNIPFCCNNQHVSRIVAHVWLALPPGDKERFLQLGDEEKIEHKRLYPAYRITPRAQSSTRYVPPRKPLSEIDEIKCKEIAEVILTNAQGEDLVSQIQDVVKAAGQFKLNPESLPSRTKASNSQQLDIDVTLAPSKAPTRKIVKKPAKSPSKPRSSSTRTSKATLAGVYTGMTNPRRGPAVSYAEFSDDDLVDELVWDNGTICSPSESAPSLTSRSASVDSAEPPAFSIDTKPRFVTPPVAGGTLKAEESFEWTMDASLHGKAFGDEYSFDGAYIDFEDEFDSTAAFSSPYAAFGVHYPLGLTATHESIYHGAQQALHSDIEVTTDMEISVIKGTDSLPKSIYTEYLR